MNQHQQDSQLELSFAEGGGEDGLSQWRKERLQAIEKLARQLGLPLNHVVEIWLRDGVRLRGRLLLKEEYLLIEDRRDMELQLSVDGVSFAVKEIEGCCRMD